MDTTRKRAYGRKCVVCGVAFESACTNARYCDTCRFEVIKANQRAKYAREKKKRHLEPTCTVYTCKRCGRHIKAHGLCTNRRICDNCLTASNNRNDYALLMQRKEVREDVIG